MPDSPASPAVADWMGDIRPDQLGFPLEIDRSLYTKETGLTFKQTPSGPLKLDAYRPTNAGGAPVPLVVMMHGGGWHQGGRYQMGLSRWAGYLASSGLAVVSIDYRLAPDTQYPDSFCDCLDAIDWAVDHASDLGADPERVGLWGDSAGGHLVLLTATTQTRPDFSGPRLRNGAERVRAVVAWYPPTDMVDIHASERRSHDGPSTTAERFMGCLPEADPVRWAEASPLEQAHAAMPPSLVLQGTRDLLVPHRHAVRFAERLDALGARHESHIVDGAPHGFDRVAPGAEARRLIERSRTFLVDALRDDES